jgi:hypothetical protein
MRVFGLLLMFLSLPLMASTKLTTQIYDVDYGRNPGDEILVLLTSGHVAKLAPEKKDLLNRLQENKVHKSYDTWFDITLDKERFITAVKNTEAPLHSLEQPTPLMKIIDNSYVPTTVASMAVAQKYHREGRRNSKESQCFNRATVWSYEWWKKHSVKSNKIFVFFTRNYIRRYNFEWWFHIAPYLHVMDNGKVVERAMDLKYTSGPRSFRQWTDIFMRNDAECKVITRYSDYADYPYTGECYIMRTNMYTYQPADLEMQEAWGYKKDGFLMNEVRGAYLEAYDINL